MYTASMALCVSNIYLLKCWCERLHWRISAFIFDQGFDFVFHYLPVASQPSVFNTSFTVSIGGCTTRLVGSTLRIIVQCIRWFVEVANRLDLALVWSRMCQWTLAFTNFSSNLFINLRKMKFEKKVRLFRVCWQQVQSSPCAASLYSQTIYMSPAVLSMLLMSTFFCKTPSIYFAEILNIWWLELFQAMFK